MGKKRKTKTKKHTKKQDSVKVIYIGQVKIKVRQQQRKSKWDFFLNLCMGIGHGLHKKFLSKLLDYANTEHVVENS